MGREINRNRLIALISAILLDETPGADHRDRLGDLLGSEALSSMIGAASITATRRGYRNVIDEADPPEQSRALSARWRLRPAAMRR